MKIAAQVMSGEVILVMFSGVGPLPILIAKKQPQVKEIYAIELNPTAHYYCLENVRINKLAEKIFPIQGNVREICPKLDLTFDRILMPLPKGAREFLDVAIKCAKTEGIIHFYHWASEWDLFSEAEELFLNTATKLGREIVIQSKVKVLPYAPRKWKVRLDIRVY
jgi:tRNA (guanine37-N1)-methyltransferase